jgi:phage N-6-adenine-methyltransferase
MSVTESNLVSDNKVRKRNDFRLALVTREEWPVFRGVSYEEHVSTWLEVDSSMQGHLWMLAAIAASLVKKYGEDVTGKFASDVGSSRRRVQEYAQTYQTWKKRDRSRFSSLSFKHHTIGARAEDPEAALEVAVEEELSARELEEFIQTGEMPERSVHFSSESAEWYTPKYIIERVVSVLGAIDLDPCADPGRGVAASQHLTKNDDGLSVEWSGRVFMNPPYRKGKETRLWVEKLLRDFEGGDVEAAVVLIPARTDTGWFALLDAYPRCFVRGRLKFSGHENSAPFPSAVVYLGDDKAAFIEAFRELGTVFERVGA